MRGLKTRAFGQSDPAILVAAGQKKLLSHPDDLDLGGGKVSSFLLRLAEFRHKGGLFPMPPDAPGSPIDAGADSEARATAGSPDSGEKPP